MLLVQTVLHLPRDTLGSVQFLSRLPAWRLVRLDAQPDFRATAHTFPLAGAVIGLVAWLIVFPFLLTGITPALAALILVATLILVTGGLHEDGLADVADGFWGGHDVARKLAIMRDSSIGTYGTLALVVVTGARWLLWTGVFARFDGLFLLLMVMAVCGLSRSALLVPWIVLPAVRPASTPDRAGKSESGLSVRFGEPDVATGLRALAVSLALFGCLAAAGWSAAVMVLGALAATATLCALARHHIDGHTGDVLGATQQMAEVGLLFGLALVM